jgi:Na+-driven multidrug efflux pump
MFSVSDLILQPVLNSFGPSAIAGNSAANSIGNLIYAFCAAISSAMVTYMGQNIGAKNIKRVRNSFLHSVWLTALIASSGFIVYIFGRPLLSLYLPGDPAAIEAGILKMKYSLLFFIILQLNPILSNAIQTFGHSIITMINSIISVFIFRFVWVYLIFPQFGTLENYFLSFLVSESMQLIISVFAFWIVYKIQKKKINQVQVR